MCLATGFDAAQEVCSAPACVSKWRQEIAAISREVCERPLGVDVPGVGCVGSFEISPLEVIALRDGMPEEPATLPGEPYRPGEIPPSLRRYLDDDTSELLGVSRGESEVAAKEVADALDRRQELLGALIGASWALMEDSVPERIEMTVSLRPMCLLCRRSADTREWINHREDCKTERVRKILLELGGIVVPTGSHEGEPEARTIGGEPVRMPANAVIGAELLDPYVNGAEPLAEPPAKGAPDGAAVAIGEADIEALNRYAALEADRNKLVTRLLFTARSKVQRDLSGAYCGECGVYLGVGPHAASCLSGEILTILAQLCSLAGDPMPSAARKEAAAEGAAL